MEYTTLNLNLVSAKDLKRPTFTRRMDVYAVASISGSTTRKVQKLRTDVVKNGNSDPTWNFSMKFFIDEPTELQNCLTLVVKVKIVGMFGGKTIGEVGIPVKELLDGAKGEGKPTQSVSYQMRGATGKPKGILSLMYQFGESFTGKPVEMITAYHRGVGGGHYSSLRAYDTYPPPELRNSGMRFGLLGGGLLGGILPEEIASDVARGGGF